MNPVHKGRGASNAERPGRGQGGNILERCKTCGKECHHENQTMTYSVYGYCSWDCLSREQVKPLQQPAQTQS